MVTYGIDVSKHNGVINWKKVASDKKNPVDFVIIRAGFGKVSTQKDPQFENNYKGCKDNGIRCGCYWYSYATTPEEAEAEARCCLNAIKDKEFDYPVYFDVEEPCSLGKGKIVVSSMVKAFCNIIEQAGYWAGIYMSASPATNLLTAEVKQRYAMWVADWRPNRNDAAYTSQHGMWQFTDKGTVAGIKSDVDKNKCTVDYPSAISKKSVATGFKPDADGKKYIEVVVKKGDCLWNLAVKYLGAGARYREIKVLNNLKSDCIKVGQRLKIPKC